MSDRDEQSKKNPPELLFKLNPPKVKSRNTSQLLVLCLVTVMVAAIVIGGLIALLHW